MSGWANDYAGNAYESYDDAAPRVYECEAVGCAKQDLCEDDGGIMRPCADCESQYCPAHLVPDKDCHVELCIPCRERRDAMATVPR